VDRPAFRFPLAGGYADPVVFRWQGAWYFVSTDDNRNDIGIRVRKADRVEGLFAEDVKDALDAGMNVHVSKPIDMELLKKTVNQYVKKREPL